VRGDKGLSYPMSPYGMVAIWSRYGRGMVAMGTATSSHNMTLTS